MNLSVIVLTHNNEASIKACLESVKQAKELIVMDDYSSDKTEILTRQFKVKFLRQKLTSFSNQRNLAAAQATCPWILFLDSDEIISPVLWSEINQVIKLPTNSVYRFKRLNYFFGKAIRHGGYWPDWQTRLFKKSDFLKYTGKIHETPRFKGNLGSLINHLLHYSHKNLSEGLIKSAHWTKLEAVEFIKAGHPPITWWRIIKVMVGEFSYRYFIKLGFLDGYIGFVESLIQAMNRFFVYQQIWELQQK